MGPRFPTQLGPRGFPPGPIRSVLLFGPPSSGKRLLVNAICTQLGAVKFDLTPSNLRGQFPAKQDVKMLVHLVSKVNWLEFLKNICQMYYVICLIILSSILTRI